MKALSLGLVKGMFTFFFQYICVCNANYMNNWSMNLKEVMLFGLIIHASHAKH